ncbi:hypothetical protein QFZ62_001753 [Clavibacter sp. B3I6]|uniref:hypothetical protein n=1 Tax=Clavibacter sp. B3I6 TaxID=3042268 RepID=UPI0027858D44|nr:hypothetical protein [Clavibacter sp. B3I6]MDQ0744445.1 hypothetical protein [Clavibacter sp. B3I6]
MTRTRTLRTSLLGTVIASGIALGVTACSTPGLAPALGSATAGAPAVMTVGDVTPGGTTVLALTSLDDAVFFLGLEGDGTSVRSVATFRGSDPDENWERVDAVGSPDPDAVTVTGAGYWPDAATEPLSTIHGQVGSAVVAVDVVAQDGEIVAADVGDGRYVAAWRGADLSYEERPADAVTLVAHLEDGSTTRAPYLELTAG